MRKLANIVIDGNDLVDLDHICLGSTFLLHARKPEFALGFGTALALLKLDQT